MLAEQVTGNHTKKISFSTKAETLLHLLPVLTSARILPLHFFTWSAWQSNSRNIISELHKTDWFQDKLIVRSSAIGEDSHESSCAGNFSSILDVKGEEQFIDAVEKVFASYQDTNPNHQVLVQPLLTDVALAGVVFGQDPNTGGPYLVINYDDSSGDTATITSGQSNNKCHIHHYQSEQSLSSALEKIKKMVMELTNLLGTVRLDIEFGVNQAGDLYLFQVRPLITQVKTTISIDTHQLALERIAYKISQEMKPHPYLHGKQAVYGVMPDWNPAEIIGVRPKPLALSLYKEVITDAVWAYQRDNYGYANLRSFPLLVDFEGLPYIDVRVSFNSFLPKDLPNDLANRLVNYYLERLIEHPVLHDKVEFDIVFSCYTLDLKKRLTVLDHYGFSQTDREIIFNALITLTNGIIHNKKGLWKKDLEKIYELEKRQDLIFNSDLDLLAKMYWILEDCKRYGTLPFAGLARAGFIAVQILKSFVAVGIINEKEYTTFISTVNSVSSNMTVDFHQLSKEQFLKKYGHLRPGTYDILSPRYDENPDLYFDWENKNDSNVSLEHPFSLSISQLRMIQEFIENDKLELTVLELLEFIKTAIEAREYAKFVFSRSISEFLLICTQLAAQYDISPEDCAYIHLSSILSMYSSTIDPAEKLNDSIVKGKKLYELTSAITLPPLITNPSQVSSFELPDTSPNFITQKSTTGSVVFSNVSKELLQDAILFIASADPGYDWIFSHKIAGFVTQYGGVNSHMAIRAGELGIPAIIGAGELKYKQWSHAKRLHIDCLNKQVQLL